MVFLESSKKTAWQWVRETGLSFLKAVESGPDFLYFILVICYVVSEYAERINWTTDIFSVYRFNFLDYFVLFGSGAYLCYKITVWKKLVDKPYILLPLILAVGALCGLFLMFLDQDWKHNKVVFTIVIDFFLCLMAYGKNYKKLLQCIVFIPAATLLIAGLGMLAGLTQDFTKMGQAETTHSLGIIYPNTWGYIAFQGMLLAWYLFLRKKPLLTFALFWAGGVFMYFVVGCRTIAVLSLAFPPITLLAGWLDRRERKPGKKPGFFAWLAICLPVICCLATIVLSLEKDWVTNTFYRTPLRSTAMRFVQSGIAFDQFGFPLIGRPMTIYQPISWRSTLGIVEDFYVMDNAYSSFIILKGVLWTAACLAWLTFAQWKCWKNKDYSILLIGSFMLVFAVMERPGLEVWYNFVLLYPLASIAEPMVKKPQKKGLR